MRQAEIYRKEKKVANTASAMMERISLVRMRSL